jgi:hypothetical protein
MVKDANRVQILRTIYDLLEARSDREWRKLLFQQRGNVAFHECGNLGVKV